MGGGAWWAAVHGVAKSQTHLSDFTFYFPALEKEMATHSSTLARRIPGAGEPGGLLSMGSHRVGRDCSASAAAAAASVQRWLQVCSRVTRVYVSASELDQAVLLLHISWFPAVLACRWLVVDALGSPVFLSAAQGQLIRLESDFKLGPPCSG